MTGKGSDRGMIQWTAAGCGGYVKHAMIAPRVCGATPTWVGIIYCEHSRPNVVRAYSFDQHRGLLDVYRPFSEHNEQELRRRRNGEHPQPIAFGREAREVIAATYRWAAKRESQR